MHVALVVENPSGTKGPDIQANNLLKALDLYAKPVDHITVICKTGCSPRYQSSAITVASVLDPNHPVASILNLVNRSRQADLVHLFAADWKIVVPTLFSTKTPILVGTSTNFRALPHRVAMRIRRPPSVFASVEPFEKATTRFGYPSEKTFFIPNGIDTDVFCPVGSKQKSKLRENISDRHNISLKENIVIWVNHLNEHKRPLLGISAFQKLHDKRNDISLLIIGDGPLAESVQSDVNDIQDAHLLGLVNHERIHQYYQASDAGLLTSYSEGISNVIYETMACGVPIVTATSFDQVGKGEFGRYLSPNSDEKKIASSLDNVLDRSDELGTLARDHIFEHHGLPAFAGKYTELYEWCLQRGSTPDFRMAWKEDNIRRIHRTSTSKL